MTKDQTLAIMAAQIYSVRTTTNPLRQRRDTARRDAVLEAAQLYEAVRDRDPGEERE